MTVNNTKKDPKKYLPIVLAAGFLLIVVGYLLYQKYLIAAVVNGQTISRMQIISELEKQAGRNILDSIITETLILQNAKKNNIELDNSEIEKELKNIEDSISAQGTTLEEALSQQKMSKDDLRGNIKIQLLVEKLVKSDKISVTDKEVEKYLDDNKELFEEDEKPDKKEIKEQLLAQKIQTEIQKYISEETSKAKINYFGNYNN